MLLLSPKSVASHEIPSGKVDESALIIMPKPVFVQELNDDYNDNKFEFTFLIHIFSARDNQTQQSVMYRNVSRPPGKQGLLGVKSLKKNQPDEWLHYHKYGRLNVIWFENILDKPCVNLVRYLSILGRYFYTHTFVFKTYLLLLAVYCHLKTDYLKDTHNCFRIIWTNGLTHRNLSAFAKDHKD